MLTLRSAVEVLRILLSQCGRFFTEKTAGLFMCNRELFQRHELVFRESSAVATRVDIKSPRCLWKCQTRIELTVRLPKIRKYGAILNGLPEQVPLLSVLYVAMPKVLFNFLVKTVRPMRLKELTVMLIHSEEFGADPELSMSEFSDSLTNLSVLSWQPSLVDMANLPIGLKSFRTNLVPHDNYDHFPGNLERLTLLNVTMPLDRLPSKLRELTVDFAELDIAVQHLPTDLDHLSIQTRTIEDVVFPTKLRFLDIFSDIDEEVILRVPASVRHLRIKDTFDGIVFPAGITELQLKGASFSGTNLPVSSLVNLRRLVLLGSGTDGAMFEPNFTFPPTLTELKITNCCDLSQGFPALPPNLESLEINAPSAFESPMVLQLPASVTKLDISTTFSDIEVKIPDDSRVSWFRLLENGSVFGDVQTWMLFTYQMRFPKSLQHFAINHRVPLYHFITFPVSLVQSRRTFCAECVQSLGMFGTNLYHHATKYGHFDASDGQCFQCGGFMRKYAVRTTFVYLA